MAEDTKKTEFVKVWMGDKLYVALNRLAAADDRKLSEYVGLVLGRHVFGHDTRQPDEEDGANRGE